jgi:hypothetical protein
MTHDYPLATHGPEPLIAFLKAAERHHSGELSRDELRAMWVRQQWGQCIGKALAREMVQ